jgi:hypothetical protein
MATHPATGYKIVKRDDDGDVAPPGQDQRAPGEYGYWSSSEAKKDLKEPAS